jgi:lipoprotein-releasing system ATP-binding protein
VARQPAEAAVVVEDLSKTYHTGDTLLTVLHRLSLKVRRSTITAVVGRSGSGKTTLLNLIGGLDKGERGRVVVRGRDLEACTEQELSYLRNRYIVFIFQFHNLLSEFTAVENVMIPSLIHRYDLRQAYRKAAALLDDLGLSDRLHTMPNRLSGGESQRVSIARALINDPEIVLADEPTGNLDTETAEMIQELLFRTVRVHGRTLLVVTHSPSVVSSADQSFRLEGGRLIPLLGEGD